ERMPAAKQVGIWVCVSSGISYRVVEEELRVDDVCVRMSSHVLEFVLTRLFVVNQLLVASPVKDLSVRQETDVYRHGDEWNCRRVPLSDGPCIWSLDQCRRCLCASGFSDKCFSGQD